MVVPIFLGSSGVVQVICVLRGVATSLGAVVARGVASGHCVFEGCSCGGPPASAAVEAFHPAHLVPHRDESGLACLDVTKHELAALRN